MGRACGRADRDQRRHRRRATLCGRFVRDRNPWRGWVWGALSRIPAKSELALVFLFCSTWSAIKHPATEAVEIDVAATDHEADALSGAYGSLLQQGRKR